MSYFVCPDCGKKLCVFGESHIDEVAKLYGTKVLAKLPHTIPTLAGTNMISVVKSQNRFVLLWNGCWMLIAAKESGRSPLHRL